ncbi:hypothetical protein AB6Q56_14755 [Dechloromonas sp. ARDL1]|uniref:hypothetical protein n=1 Tax=Dechloromonas sp. ARDL1 TaxID=3322121 RepID=UPI003DA77D83
MNVKQALAFPALCAGLLLSGQVLAESVIHVGPGGSVKFYPAHDAGGKSAQQVQQELEAFKRNPVSADGVYRYVGGDQGWVIVPHEYAYRDGKWQHVDKLPHNTPAPRPMTPEERKQRDAMYPPG